jgi:predicted nuclease of predicted toxin-antitoxin system
VRLLFNQNLSPRLIDLLFDVYPNSSHVSRVGLDRAPDEEVWAYTRENGYLTVTKDADFDELSQVRGSPPKVIWLRLGNCTTNQIEAVLRSRREAVASLDTDPGAATLTLLR